MTDQDWTKPAAKAIPKEGYFELERGRYGADMPRNLVGAGRRGESNNVDQRAYHGFADHRDSGRRRGTEHLPVASV